MATPRLSVMEKPGTSVRAAPNSFVTKRILVAGLVALFLLATALFFFFGPLHQSRTPNVQTIPPPAPVEQTNSQEVPLVPASRPAVPFEQKDLFFSPCPGAAYMVQIFRILYHLQIQENEPARRQVTHEEGKVAQALLNDLVTTAKANLEALKNSTLLPPNFAPVMLLAKQMTCLGFDNGVLVTDKDSQKVAYSNSKAPLAGDEKYVLFFNPTQCKHWRDTEFFSVAGTYYKAIVLGVASGATLENHFRENDLYLRGADEQNWTLCAFDGRTETDIKSEDIWRQPDTIVYKTVPAEAIDLKVREKVPQFEYNVNEFCFTGPYYSV